MINFSLKWTMQIENCSINQRTLSIYMTYMLLYSGGASVPHAAKFTPNETDHPNFYVHKKAIKRCYSIINWPNTSIRSYRSYGEVRENYNRYQNTSKTPLNLSIKGKIVIYGAAIRILKTPLKSSNLSIIGKHL